MLDRSVVINWQLASSFGWGVYGINLMLNWSLQNSHPLLTKARIDEAAIDLNPIEWQLLRPALEASRELYGRLAPLAGRRVSLDAPVLHALGNDFAAGKADAAVGGSPDIGVIFCEATRFSARGRQRAARYRAIVAGSSWNRRLLEDAGIGPVVQVVQGIDPTAFHAGPKAGLFAGRFAVFSGGKLEYRKGQDLVIKAFAAFARRHPEALLAAAWTSPWPAAARTLDEHSAVSAVPFGADGRPDCTAWAAANGIRADQFVDLGPLRNSALPRLYREMDVALFPNRCEGGTNLVAMECLACGVPTILSRNTGHLDLIAPDRCFSLDRQTPIPGDDRLGWGESDVEEIVELLESAHRDRAAAAERGARAADFMTSMTWADTARQLAGVVASYL